MKTIRKSFRSPVTAAVLFSGLVFLLIIGSRGAGYLESLELTAYDLFTRLKPISSEAAPRVAIIGISEKDIRQIGRWPLTDAILANTLEILSRCKPRAIGVDIFRDIPVPPGGQELDSVLSGKQHIIMAMKFGDEGVPPPPVLKDTDQVGFNDILVDPGGIVRRAMLFLDDGETVFYSFALRLSLLYLHSEGITAQPDENNPQHIRLGTSTIKPFEENEGSYVRADSRGYQFLMNYQKASFPIYNLSDLLSGKVDQKLIQDRVILIGIMAQSVKDFFYTPESRGFSYARPVPGVVLHAHIVSQLLGFALDGKSQVKTLKNWQETIWILIWSIMGGAMGLWFRSATRFSLCGSAGILILCAVAYLSFLNGLWIPLLPPVLTWLIAAAVMTAYILSREKRRRALLMKLFSKHVSQEVAENIWQQRDQFMEDGRPRSQELAVTVLFSDLKGYTSVSEKMTPKSLIDWLNTYLESMTKLVMDYGGVIDDYAGDGIKANFGVPLARTTEAEIRKDAINAVNCALAMEEEMQRLNVQWQKQALSESGMRIGIFTGPVVAGTIGSSQRMKYTTVGDAVNIAARLESYDKTLARKSLCRILIGESTLNYLDNGFRTEKVGEASLKGKDQYVNIFRVLGREDMKVNHHFEEVTS